MYRARSDKPGREIGLESDMWKTRIQVSWIILAVGIAMLLAVAPHLQSYAQSPGPLAEPHAEVEGNALSSQGSEAKSDSSPDDLRDLAGRGLASAQIDLAIKHAEGDGVEKNDSEAVRWLRMAVEQGDPVAQYDLALMYNEGRGVERDDAEAARLLRMAADQSLPEAQYSLGLMHSEGRGVEQSDAEAARLWKMAAEAGNVNAQHNIGVMYATGQGVGRNEGEAVRWWKMAADAGDPLAQRKIGALYHNGLLGTQLNMSEAANWYRKAAELGDPRSQALLGRFYLAGVGGLDSKEALLWFRRAAEQGDAGAFVGLSFMYKKGLGVSKDRAEARRLMGLAKENGLGQPDDLSGSWRRPDQVAINNVFSQIEWVLRTKSFPSGFVGSQNIPRALDVVPQDTLTLSQPVPAFETRSQRDARVAAEEERREAASKALAARNFSSDIAALRTKHIGRTYIFNPTGIAEKHPRKNYSYEPFPIVISQFVSEACLADYSCDLRRPPDSGVLAMSKPVPFKVTGINSRLCLTASQYVSKRSENSCYWYEVEIVNTKTGLLMGERSYNEAGKNFRLQGNCTDDFNIYCSSYYLSDPLAELEKNPFLADQLRGYLSDMPEVMLAQKSEYDRLEAARKAEEQRVAAERRAEEQRVAAGRRAEEQRVAAERRKAAEQEEQASRLKSFTERYGADIANAIIEKRVVEGMTKSVVVEAWGQPTKRTTVPPSDEMWSYSNGKLVFFAEGKVRSVE